MIGSPRLWAGVLAGAGLALVFHLRRQAERIPLGPMTPRPLRRVPRRGAGWK